MRRRSDLETVIVAMTDHGQVYDYPTTVGLEIDDDRQDDYVRAAAYLNSGGFEAVSLQHEFEFSAAKPEARSWRFCRA